ncbi:MAG: hypothetical protein WD738_14785 [Pirellulales bacterium]
MTYLQKLFYVLANPVYWLLFFMGIAALLIVKELVQFYRGDKRLSLKELFTITAIVAALVWVVAILRSAID